MRTVALLIGAVMSLSATSAFSQSPPPEERISGTGAAITAGRETNGQWTTVAPGLSQSRCQSGEYAVGVEVIGAPTSVKYCIGCVTQLRVICQSLK